MVVSSGAKCEHRSHFNHGTAADARSRAVLTILSAVWQARGMATSARAAPGLGKRARNRAVVEAQILTVARAHLATHGAAGLSLRAVARDLGMVSSGIYRYVESRDELLTAPHRRLLHLPGADGGGGARLRAAP